MSIKKSDVKWIIALSLPIIVSLASIIMTLRAENVGAKTKSIDDKVAINVKAIEKLDVEKVDYKVYNTDQKHLSDTLQEIKVELKESRAERKDDFNELRDEIRNNH
jgi:chromosome segregation ATPase